MTEIKLRFGSHRVRTARNARVPITSSVGVKSPSGSSTHHEPTIEGFGYGWTVIYRTR